MANDYLPHIFVIPEDDANRQIALAFLLELGMKSNRYKLFPPQEVGAMLLSLSNWIMSQTWIDSQSDLSFS
jgi:hypothetical protein